MARALITGITGQDGQHLAEFLHEKGYEVFGVVKGQNNPRAQQIREEFPFVQVLSGDLTDLP
ncbi:MAG: GDP-mannose 4,6-dehydratase, partial [Actinomycetota bacterium]